MLLRQLGTADSSVTGVLDSSQALKSYYLSLGAASAVLSFAETSMGLFLSPGTLHVSFAGAGEGHMAMDGATVQALELVAPSDGGGCCGGGGASCLFALLNRTRTAGGARLLRASLLQPLRDAAAIDARLDAVDELIAPAPPPAPRPPVEDDDGGTVTENEGDGAGGVATPGVRRGTGTGGFGGAYGGGAGGALWSLVSAAVAAMPRDVERVLGRFAVRPKSAVASMAAAVAAIAGDPTPRIAAALEALLQLRTALVAVPALRDSLHSAQSGLLAGLRDGPLAHPALGEALAVLDGVLDEEVVAGRSAFLRRTAQLYAVRRGRDSMLDASRGTFCEVTEAVHDLAGRLRATEGYPTALKLMYAARRGFFFEVRRVEGGGAPSTYLSSLLT